MDFRPATARDLAAEFEVFALAQRELYERRGAKWAGRDFSEWERLHLHLLHHDGARSFVAEEADRVVGFTAAWVREEVSFLSALFVHPEWQGRGIGTRLLDLAWGEAYASDHDHRGPPAGVDSDLRATRSDPDDTDPALRRPTTRCGAGAT